MSSKRTIQIATLVAVTVIASTIGINSVIAEDPFIAFDKSGEPEQDLIAKIDEQQARSADRLNQEYSVKALSDSSLKTLGPQWEIMSVDTVGTVEPFEVTKVIVTARMIEHKDNIRQCEFETDVVITYDAKTGNVLEKDIPELDVCEKPITLGRQATSANLPDFIPQADASSSRAFLTSEQGSDAGHYGGYGKIKVPSLDESLPTTIFSEMDDMIYFGYNQEINGEFFQVGWLVDDSIGKHLVFADEYTYGNVNAHGISLTWTNNGDATVYIQCGTADDYYIYMYHGNSWFTHDTNYDCDNTTDNTINNSVWLENANTVSTSDWSDEITSTVKAWNMKEFETKYTVSNWNSASNTYENCPSGSGSTTNISSTLGNGGTSVWTVSGIDDC